MYDLLQTGAISEVKGSQNVTYILNDDSLFLLTGYKVLKSQSKNGFTKCVKLLYNGKIKLMYYTSGYKSLASILPSLNINAFLPILKDLLGVILEIRNNGFLYCQNLELSFEKIFIDQNNLTANLVYLPLNTQPSDFAAVENDLRTRLKHLISSAPSLKSAELDRICAELSNTSVSLSDLCRLVCDMIQPELVFSTMDAQTHLEFRIKKPEFIIGRNAASVDGMIGFNKTIGRVHCKIIYEDKQYHIVDLGSVNGTFVNESRTIPFEMHPIKSGDVVRIANSDFAVHI